YHPETDELLVHADTIINEALAKLVEEAGIETVEVRSPLTCETKKGICAKCYGRNLATGKPINMGEAVGVIGAQSIGEPGTQLTLRTFHQGGTAGNVSENPSIVARRDGIVEMDEVRTVTSENEEGKKAEILVSRSTEFRLVADNELRTPLMITNVPYGSELLVKPGDKVKKGDVIAKWDPYNAVIIAESAGKVEYEDIIQGVSFQLEIDEQTGFEEKVISESRNKKAVPTLKEVDAKGVEQRAYNLPVGAHLMVNDGEKIKAGKVMIKIPRKSAKAGDITGGLPRVTELFEARNPSNPAVVTEIDGVVSYGKIKRGNRELIVEAKTGERKIYLVKLSKQILVQENDFVTAGSPLSDGSVTPDDILKIKGPTAGQEYLVNEIQEVYRLQGVKIDDKHFEIIVRQMMTKVEIVDGGDTQFLEGALEHKFDFLEENN